MMIRYSQIVTSSDSEGISNLSLLRSGYKQQIIIMQQVRKKLVDNKLAAMFVNAVDQTSGLENIGSFLGLQPPYPPSH